MKKKRKSEPSFSSQVVIITISVIAIVLILFNFSNKTEQIPVLDIPIEKPATDIIVYPNSKLGITTQVSDQLTYNYIAPDGVSYPEIIEYYKNEMDDRGWDLIVSDDTQAIFEKGDRKVRVWILYLDVRPNTDVEYIIDYSP